MSIIYRASFAILVTSHMAWSTASAGPLSGMHPLQSDRFVMTIGGYYADIDGHYRLDDPDGGVGTEVNFDNLGLDESRTLLSASFVWRWTNSIRIEGEYYDLSEDSRHTLTKTINWGDAAYDIGASVDTDMNVEIARAFFGYSFIKDNRKEIGAGIGLHFGHIDAFLRGNATVDGIPVTDFEEGFDEWGLLPNIGLYGNYSLSPKWLLAARIDWLSANVGDYSGHILDVEGAIQYQAFDHFGIGLAYRLMDLEIEADRDNGDWEANLEYSGPVLYITANF